MIQKSLLYDFQGYSTNILKHVDYVTVNFGHTSCIIHVKSQGYDSDRVFTVSTMLILYNFKSYVYHEMLRANIIRIFSYLMTTGDPGSIETPSFIGTLQLNTPQIPSLVE